MPNRVVREGILDSDKMDTLVRNGGWAAESFYRRLHSVADDYGIFDARPVVLRSRCYPTLVDIVREADVSRWLAECEKAGLIRLYEADCHKYLEIIEFRQQVRVKKRRFPAPPENVHSRCAADDEQMRTETKPNQSETETETETKPKEDRDAIPVGLDVPEFVKTWETFIRHRKEIKHPLKRTARDQLLLRLDSWGITKAIEALETTIANGWQGVFEPKQNGKHVDSTKRELEKIRLVTSK